MLPYHIQSELNLLNAIGDIIDKLKEQHQEEISELQKQHTERMAELQKQSIEAQKQFEVSLSKANTQIKIAWGAFAISFLSLVVTIITLCKAL